MRLTLPAKLLAIAMTASVAFIMLIVTGAVTDNEVAARMTAIQSRYIPRLQLRPHLENDLDKMARAFQDAVAAQDIEELARTKAIEETFLERISKAGSAVDPSLAGELRAAMRAYHATAANVSRRMIAEEGGDGLIDEMADMQAKRAQVAALIERSTTFHADELSAAFMAGAVAQERAARIRLFTSLGSLVLLLLLSLWISRGVARALTPLIAGLERFGKGNFQERIPVTTGDELGDVARRANEMAQSLDRLGRERDREEWLKTGTAGLGLELRGELDPGEAASCALEFLARYLDAPAGALYYTDGAQRFRLLGAYAMARSVGAVAPMESFVRGEGLAGQATNGEEIVVVKDPPADYLRVRSGLGGGTPRVLVYLPLVHVGEVRGVVELAFFKDWTEDASELLRRTREFVTIALEVARARDATRALLVATQQQASRLETQEEELRATNDELQAQQEELRRANQDLTAQAAELDRQRRVLEEKNHELDLSQRRLEQKAAELTTVSAYKSQFLANMSHELRTPLNSMLLLSNLLTENQRGNLTPKQVEYCKTINAAGNDLLALINQVLDLAKIESGKQQTYVEVVPLTRFVEHAEQLFGPLARSKKLTFKAEVTQGLPTSISTDAQRVAQILNNLIGNAIKFTERGEVSLRIGPVPSDMLFRRSDLAPARAVAFTVTDEGVGIAPEHQDRIFAPFEQVDGAADRRYGGTGLGLAIARELSELLGGELHLRSVVGEGSSFVLYLPFSLDATAAASISGTGTARAVSTSAEAQIGFVPKSIEDDRATLKPGDPFLLIIEDDPVFARTFGELVRDQGFKFIVALDGRTGLGLARTMKPSGIVLDIMLPEVDGWRVMDNLQRDPETSSIPVHFVSAIDALERGMTMGAVGYLTKPATREQLLAVIDAIAPKESGTAPILLLESSAGAEDSLVHLLEAEGMRVHRVRSPAEALESVERAAYTCLVLEFSISDSNVIDVLRSMEEKLGTSAPPAIVYTSRALSREETNRLEAYAQAIILNQGSSTAPVLDEIRLFARRLKDGLGPRRGGPQNTHPEIRLEGRKILVVDDDMRAVYALSAILGAKGAEVLVADSGVAALETLATTSNVDLVLMDIMMPEMDGYTAMRKIREEERFSALPIIALTAKAMKGDETRCLEAGANAYLPKPIDPERLMELLGSYAARDRHDASPG